jgi:hypothetical protein
LGSEEIDDAHSAADRHRRVAMFTPGMLPTATVP